MKLLVAEDQRKTGMYLQQGMIEAEFSVDRIMTGTEAQARH
ncbi:two-component system, OmpR family, copper resistance phosphate regulon response regulator CusR [Pseudomonas sp. Snoq117.2]|nr:two-component system, OmpR family, copper resistance phosphate regulon response regulator CusR [Pseudomonas sp. Snoq117.2]